jgi:hypothetical protein
MVCEKRLTDCGLGVDNRGKKRSCLTKNEEWLIVWCEKTLMDCGLGVDKKKKVHALTKNEEWLIVGTKVHNKVDNIADIGWFAK